MSREIKYIIKFENESNETRVFQIKLDEKTLHVLPEDRKTEAPIWTKLTCNQCENCPLKKEEHEHCPIAYNLSNLIEEFSECNSTLR